MKYAAIGFDWGGVLNGQPGKVLNQQICEFLGVSSEQLLRTYFKYYKKVNRGQMTWDEIWTAVSTDLGHPEKARQVVKMSYEAHEDNLNPKMLDLVANLKNQGYKVGLLSNNSQDKADLMREKGLDKLFDVMDVSVETGLVKPEPAAFRHLADGLGVKLEELIYIDDSPNSLSTAEICGYTPILFESYEQLVTELQRLGVKTGAKVV